MKLNKIIEVADALSLLATAFREAEVDAKALSALSALDEGIYENLIVISEALGFKVPKADEKGKEPKTVEETETDEVTEAFGRKRVIGFTASEPEPTPIEVVSETKVKTEAAANEDVEILKDDEITPPEKIAEEVVPGYFTTKYPNILVSMDGKIIYKKNNRSGWVKASSHPDVNGNLYARIFQSNDMVQLTVSRLMLETFVGIPSKRPRGCDAGYKDGDHLNLNINNLVWLRHNNGRPLVILDETWHEACRIGVDMMKANPSVTMTAIGREISKKKLMCVGSWLTMPANHPDIFFQYFNKNGRVITLKSEESAETRILAITDKTKQIEATQIYINEKGILTETDKVLPILTCIKTNTDNLDSTANIMNKLNKRYGKLYISASLVDKVKDKKLCKELCDLVF